MFIVAESGCSSLQMYDVRATFGRIWNGLVPMLSDLGPGMGHGRAGLLGSAVICMCDVQINFNFDASYVLHASIPKMSVQTKTPGCQNRDL